MRVTPLPYRFSAGRERCDAQEYAHDPRSMEIAPSMVTSVTVTSVTQPCPPITIDATLATGFQVRGLFVERHGSDEVPNMRRVGHAVLSLEARPKKTASAV